MSDQDLPVMVEVDGTKYFGKRSVIWDGGRIWVDGKEVIVNSSLKAEVPVVYSADFKNSSLAKIVVYTILFTLLGFAVLGILGCV